MQEVTGSSPVSPINPERFQAVGEEAGSFNLPVAAKAIIRGSIHG